MSALEERLKKMEERVKKTEEVCKELETFRDKIYDLIDHKIDNLYSQLYKEIRQSEIDTRERTMNLIHKSEKEAREYAELLVQHSASVIQEQLENIKNQ